MVVKWTFFHGSTSPPFTCVSSIFIVQDLLDRQLLALQVPSKTEIPASRCVEWLHAMQDIGSNSPSPAGGKKFASRYIPQPEGCDEIQVSAGGHRQVR